MDLLENECGFASYKIEGQTVYLRDLYVIPSARKSGEAAKLADMIAVSARAWGCTRMLGSVSPKDPNVTSNIKVLLAYGMSFLSATSDLIYFVKEI